MERFEDSLSQEVLLDGGAKDALQYIRETATGSDSSLLVTNGLIENYDLRALSAKNQAELGTVRAARFRNGLFLSFRMLVGEQNLQPEMRFYDDNPRTNPNDPNMTIWSLHTQWGSLSRASLPFGPSDRHRLLSVSARELVAKSHAIIKQETENDRQWEHAYTPMEIARVRKRGRNILHRVRYVKPKEIQINPDLNEPYL